MIVFLCYDYFIFLNIKVEKFLLSYEYGMHDAYYIEKRNRILGK